MLVAYPLNFIMTELLDFPLLKRGNVRFPEFRHDEIGQG